MSSEKDHKIWRKVLSGFEDNDYRNLASWSKPVRQRFQEGVLIFPRSCRSKGRFETFTYKAWRLVKAKGWWFPFEICIMRRREGNKKGREKARPQVIFTEFRCQNLMDKPPPIDHSWRGLSISQRLVIAPLAAALLPSPFKSSFWYPALINGSRVRRWNFTVPPMRPRDTPVMAIRRDDCNNEGQRMVCYVSLFGYAHMPE